MFGEVAQEISKKVVSPAWPVRRAHPSRRLLLVSFAVYAAMALVNLVSLHVIDRVADLAWHGLTLVQGLKLVSPVLVLYGVRNASGSLNPSEPLWAG